MHVAISQILISMNIHTLSHEFTTSTENSSPQRGPHPIWGISQTNVAPSGFIMHRLSGGMKEGQSASIQKQLECGSDCSCPFDTIVKSLAPFVPVAT